MGRLRVMSSRGDDDLSIAPHPNLRWDRFAGELYGRGRYDVAAFCEMANKMIRLILKEAGER